MALVQARDWQMSCEWSGWWCPQGLDWSYAPVDHGKPMAWRDASRARFTQREGGNKVQRTEGNRARGFSGVQWLISDCLVWSSCFLPLLRKSEKNLKVKHAKKVLEAHNNMDNC